MFTLTAAIIMAFIAVGIACYEAGRQTEADLRQWRDDSDEAFARLDAASRGRHPSAR